MTGAAWRTGRGLAWAVAAAALALLVSVPVVLWRGAVQRREALDELHARLDADLVAARPPAVRGVDAAQAAAACRNFFRFRVKGLQNRTRSVPRLWRFIGLKHGHVDWDPDTLAEWSIVYDLGGGRTEDGPWIKASITWDAGAWVLDRFEVPGDLVLPAPAPVTARAGGPP